MDNMSNNSGDDMTCGNCNQLFDENDHLPILFSNCGHTFCSTCIQEFIQKSTDGFIICPEDQQMTQIGEQGINSLPKNRTLIKMIKKKNNLLTERRSLIFNNSAEDLSTIDQDQNNMLNFSNIIQVNENDQLNNKFCSPNFHKNSQNYLDQNSNNQNNHHQSHANLCPEHNKPLDLICLDHRQKICQKCALSQQGKHRNHQINQEEEVHQELSSRAANLNLIYDQVDEYFKYIDTQQYMQSISNMIKEDQEKSMNYVEKQFKELISTLEKVKKEKLQEISQHYINITNDSKRDSKPNDKVIIDTQDWKKKAQNLLQQYNENKQKQDITYDLLPQQNIDESNNQDIIYLGEELFKNLQYYKQMPIEKFKKKQQEGLLLIEFDDSSLNSEILTKMFCKIQKNLVKSNGDEDQNFANQSNRQQQEGKQEQNYVHKGQQQYNPKTSQEYSSHGDMVFMQDIQQRIPTSNVDENDLLDFNNIGFNSFGDNPVMEQSANLATSIKLPTMNNYNAQFNKQNNAITSGQIISGKQANHQTWMSYSMANFNPEILQQYSPQIQQNGQIIFVSPTKIIKSEENFSFYEQPQQQSSQPATQSSKASQQVPKLQQLPNNNFLSPSKVNTTKSSRQNSSQKNKDSQQIIKHLNYSDNLNNSTLKDTSFSSTYTTASRKSDLPPKGLQGKKKSIPKLNDKYVSIINTLQRDQLDILDLTGAELGDSGILFVCDILKNSQNVRSLKLLKNKISDEGVQHVMNTIVSNNKILSVNFAQNNLTDQSLDFFIQFFSTQQSSIKQLCLNQNNIPLQKNKAKINELKKLGVNATV